MNRIYVSLVEAQLRAFVADFVDTARDVFFDPNQGKLIHPGEFGSFREGLVRELLARFLPESYGVSQGFVLAPNGDISTQCDVVVYSRLHAPIIHTSEQQRFFPVESVLAIGEVKSTLNCSQLQTACSKLARVKDMRAKLQAPAIAASTFKDIGPYSATEHHLDQLCTFVVANEISGDDSAIRQAIAKAAEEAPASYRTNLVLNVREWCTAYKDLRGMVWPYPVDVDPQTKRVIPGELPVTIVRQDEVGLNHIKLFLHFMQLLVTRGTILHPDLLGYWGKT